LNNKNRGINRKIKCSDRKRGKLKKALVKGLFLEEIKQVMNKIKCILNINTTTLVFVTKSVEKRFIKKTSAREVFTNYIKINS